MFTEVQKVSHFVVYVQHTLRKGSGKVQSGFMWLEINSVDGSLF
jgi:hypothetical protein